MSQGPGFRFIALMALIAGLGPISIHIIVPVLPSIDHAFASGGARTQLTLSLGLIAMAFSPLGYGPAADRWGRRPVLLWGLSLFLIGSLLCVWAPTIEVLIFGRVVQAIGGAAGIVISRALVRDRFGREESARVLGYMMTFIVLAPIFVPVISGFIAEYLNWRYVFILTAVAGIIALVVTWLAIEETGTPRRDVSFFGDIKRSFPTLLGTPQFMAYAMYAGCGMGMFLAYASGVPFIMVHVFGLTAADFGLFFMMMTTSFMAGTFSSTRITARFGLDRMIGLASSTAFLITLTIPALFLAGFGSPWALFLPAIGLGFCHGLSMPNAQAGGVSVNPAIAGSASGLMVFLQMTIGAGFAQLSGMLPKDTPYPVIGLIVFAGFAAAASFNILIRLRRGA